MSHLWRTVLLVCLLLTVSGCGVASYDPPSGPTTDPTTANPTTFPAQLVGTWEGSGQAGSDRLQFAADGRFQVAGQVRYSGTAIVVGNVMTFDIDGSSPMTLPWSLVDGSLVIGQDRYLRIDAQTDGGAVSLSGTWINANGYDTISFSDNGTYSHDEGNGTVKTGAYTLTGNELILSQPGGRSTAYTIALDTFLTFSNLNGQVVGEYTRAG